MLFIKFIPWIRSILLRIKAGKSGRVSSTISKKIRGFMTAVFSNIWIETVVLGFVVSVMLTLNMKLTLLAVLLVGIQFALAHLLSRRLKTTTRQMMSYRSILSGFIFEKNPGSLLVQTVLSRKKG